MSKYILFFFLLAALGSCKNDELMDYNSGHFLQWTMADRDSLKFSFSHYTENDELEVKLELERRSFEKSAKLSDRGCRFIDIGFTGKL